MINDLNKTLHSGRFVKDPELKIYASSNKGDIPMTKFTLAINRYTGKGKELVTTYLDFVAYRKMAEFITQWFRKGDEAFIFGTLSSRSYPSKKNVNEKVKITEIKVDEIYFGQKAKSTQSTQYNGGSESQFSPPPPTDDDMPAYEINDDLPF